MPHRHARRGFLAVLLSGALLISGLSFVTGTAAEAATPADASSASVAPAEAAPAAASAPAATASDFDPGNIISDANFFNGNAMSAGAVQNFLNAQVSSCRSGYTCLKDYTQSTYSRAADAMCNSYSGAANESAATIIAKVGQACNVSQAVLIVLLQKEQSLITDSWPGQSQYNSATGFACPDTAPCDAEYTGFYNQVYKAAWQYKRYSNPPGTSAFFNWFPVGKYSNVRYHPNAACGSSPVLIQNQATAGLYYYTPYQPNAVAMSNVYGGQSDGCSSYGNRNFWRLYTDWFGDPRGVNNPHGSFDTAVAVAAGVQVTGWAVDPASSNPVGITVTVDGQATPGTADVRLDWIPALYPNIGVNHGFNVVAATSAGTHTVCVSKSNGVDLGCKTVTVPSSTAMGYLDVADGVVGGVHISGWSLNKAAGGQTYIWANVDGSGGPYKVDKNLSWTPSLYPGIGNLHGFDTVIPASPGTHQICVYGYSSTLLGCKTAYVPSNEDGAVQSATGVLGGISITGWSLDKRTSASTYIWVDIAGTGRAFKANKPNDAAGAAYPSLGNQHGFSETIAANPGPHTVCIYGTVASTLYSCQTVTVPNNEVGSFDTAVGSMGKIDVSGWSLDQRNADITYVWVTIDGNGAPLKANGRLSWVTILYPNSGTDHGFTGQFNATAGDHTVCVWGTKETVSYGCKTVNVPSSGAASWDTATTADRSISLTGWAVDRLSTNTTYIWVTVDGVGTPYKANQPLGWINTYFPGVGPNHGFNVTMSGVAAGKHTVCMYHTFDNASLGCRDVDVPSSGATSIDSVTGVTGGVRITGWSVDRNSTARTYVWVWVDGVSAGPVAANLPLSWIDAYFPGVGPNHGIDSVVPASSGSHQVCIQATFDNRNMGCTTVTVP